MVTATSNFAAIANYATTLSTQALAYQQGIIYPYNSSPNANLDWVYFMIAMVSMNETNLKTSTAATNSTFWGILNATKDVNGRIRQRYSMVRELLYRKIQCRSAVDRKCIQLIKRKLIAEKRINAQTDIQKLTRQRCYLVCCQDKP